MQTAPSRRAVLTGVCACHFVHDGLMDCLYALLPFWQMAFDLSLPQVGLIISGYLGMLALFQIPAGMLAERFGEPKVLVGGTIVTALGFIFLGLAGGFVILLCILWCAGFASGVQHPLGAAIVAGSYEQKGRQTAIGTYNFAGDLGKVAFPALAAVLLAGRDWYWTTIVLGGITFVTALGILPVLRAHRRQGAPTRPSDREAPAMAGGWGIQNRRGFTILSMIGIVDIMSRVAFLTFLPFLVIQRGMTEAQAALALTVFFAGGAAGKYLCGVLAERLGTIATVVLTEAMTGVGILLVLALPLAPTLIFLPILGAATNGTSTVLYGSVANFAAPQRQARAFGLFYTLIFGCSAIAPPLCGVISDLSSVNVTIAVIGVGALTTIPLAWLLRTSIGSKRVRT